MKLNRITQLNVPWTVHHDINLEAITNLMHKYLYSYNITILYMFSSIIMPQSYSHISFDAS